MTEHGWVVCAPGDPNERQVEAILSMSGPYRMCMTEYNADTGEVKFEVQRPSGEVAYVVDRQGKTRTLAARMTEPDLSNIEAVYIIYSADILGDEQDIERMGPAEHMPAGYVGEARAERERIAAKFVQTEDDEEYDYGDLGRDSGDARYFPAGYADSEGVAEPVKDEPVGEGRHRKWVGELTAEEWEIFARCYLIELDANGMPERYEDTMGSITEHGHIPAVAVDNTEGWSPTDVIDSQMYVSIALKRAPDDRTGVSQ